MEGAWLSETLPDAELVSRARAGDSQCFAALCERHRNRVWRIATSVARGPDAEDLAQEAVIRAYRALGSYLGHAPFGAWLTRIALNVAHDYHRSAWRRRVTLFDRLPVEDEECGASAEGEAERRELQRRVRQAVAALPERQRVPIWLHFFEGFSIAEVARLEGAPEATVRSRVRAGLQRLSLSLHDLLPGCPPETARALEAGRNGCGA
jgi:RNA polymerase sigma-70 factor (ECF subfamily)